MKWKKVFIVLGILTSLIVVIVVGKLWLANHLGLFCDSFSGGYSDGWTYNVDGYSSGSIFTFVDTNENHIYDVGESPLPFVSGESDSSFFVTNKYGKFKTFTFKPGCCNKCWQDSSFFVNVPKGYKATIPLYYDLKSNNATFNIGFLQVEQVAHPTYTFRFPWIAAFVNNGLVITAFDYDFDYASCCVLTLEIDPKETSTFIDIANYDEMRDFLITIFIMLWIL